MTQSSTSSPFRSLAARLLVGGGAIAVAILVPMLRPPAGPERPPREAQSIAFATLREAPAEETLLLHGVVQAGSQTMPAFTVGGRVLTRPVELGERVEAGAVLARLDASGYRNAARAAAAQVAELEARAEQLGRDERRVAALEGEGVLTEAELEATRSGLARLSASREAALAQLSESRRQTREAVLRAPFSGVVREIFVDPGQVVGPGTPVVALAGEGGLEIELGTPSEAIAWIGDASVEVELVDRGERVQGTLREVSQAAGLRGLFATQVAIPAGSARPGEGALVRFTRQGAPELRAPLGAVYDPSGDRPYVWLVQDEEGSPRAHRVEVELGALRPGAPGAPPELALAAHEELAPGQRVITAGGAFLLEGDAVSEGAR